jgi:hypothetical protein
MSKSEWPPNIPDSLSNLCLEFCARNLSKTVCQPEVGANGLFRLNSSVCFPPSVGDALLSACGRISRQFLGLLEDPSVISFRRLDLRAINDLNDEDLKMVLAHNPTELQLSSDQLTSQSVRLISEMAPNLQMLSIINCPQIFLGNTDSCENLMNGGDAVDLRHHFLARCHRDRSELVVNLDCPKLRCLAVREMLLNESQSRIMFNRPMLVRLDLSDSIINMNDLNSCLKTLTSLQMLTLHNVPLKHIDQAFAAICQAKTLRFDIASSFMYHFIIYC